MTARADSNSLPSHLAKLNDVAAVRERCAMVHRWVADGRSPYFALDASRLAAVAAYVADVTREAYPDLNIPYHSRWRHFSAGGIGVAARDELAPTVDAAGREMAPAAVIGNLQVGIGLARDVGHVSRDRSEAALVEGEVGRAAVGHPAMHHAAALAHRGGIVELGEVRRRRIRLSSRRHSLRSRPTVPA